MDWQPIETAPRDGSRILLAWPRGAVGIGWWTRNSRLVPNRGSDDYQVMTNYLKEHNASAEHFIDHGEWDDYETAWAENQPSHWMPLPDSPSTPS